MKFRLFEMLLGNTALDEEVWREKERKGSSAITVSPTDQQRRNLNREEKWSTGLKGTFMEVGLVPSAGDRRGRGRGFRRDPHRGTQLGWDGRVGEGGKEIFMELGGEGGEGWLNSLSDKSGYGWHSGWPSDVEILRRYFLGFIFYLFSNQFNLFLASSIQVQPGDGVGERVQQLNEAKTFILHLFLVFED